MTNEVLISDVALDLVQVLSDAMDAEFLFGAEDVTIEDVRLDTERQSKDTVLVTLSNGQRVELRADIVE